MFHGESINPGEHLAVAPCVDIAAVFGVELADAPAQRIRATAALGQVHGIYQRTAILDTVTDVGKALIRGINVVSLRITMPGEAITIMIVLSGNPARDVVGSAEQAGVEASLEILAIDPEYPDRWIGGFHRGRERLEIAFDGRRHLRLGGVRFLGVFRLEPGFVANTPVNDPAGRGDVDEMDGGGGLGGGARLRDLDQWLSPDRANPVDPSQQRLIGWHVSIKLVATDTEEPDAGLARQIHDRGGGGGAWISAAGQP